eukprot:14403620-Alexandrium_andersonii.AAC.1
MGSPIFRLSPPSPTRPAGAPPLTPSTQSSPNPTPIMTSVEAMTVGAGTRCAIQTGATEAPRSSFQGPVTGGPRW